MPLFADLTSPQLGELLARKPLAMLPIGQLEEHGPHLPLGADAIQVAEVNWSEVGSRCRTPARRARLTAVVTASAADMESAGVIPVTCRTRGGSDRHASASAPYSADPAEPAR